MESQSLKIQNTDTLPRTKTKITIPTIHPFTCSLLITTQRSKSTVEVKEPWALSMQTRADKSASQHKSTTSGMLEYHISKVTRSLIAKLSSIKSPSCQFHNCYVSFGLPARCSLMDPNASMKSGQMYSHSRGSTRRASPGGPTLTCNHANLSMPSQATSKMDRPSWALKWTIGSHDTPFHQMSSQCAWIQILSSRTLHWYP